jgi:RNA polymerase sigma factor (TIGR02999 family)
MALPENGEITRLLQRWCAGDRDVEGPLFELLYPDLRRIAHSLTKGDHRHRTVQNTALVHELYMKLVGAKDRSFPNRKAFFSYAGKAMRRLLIDYWRRSPKAADVDLEPLGDLTDHALSKDQKILLGVAVNGVLDQLDQEHSDWCSVVEMKFFLGLDDPASAEVLGLPLRTVQRMWQNARWWLFEKLGPEPWNSAPGPQTKAGHA